jgi:hypothetical protein
VSEQLAGVVARSQASYIWGSQLRSSGAPEKVSPGLPQLLQLLVNLRTR